MFHSARRETRNGSPSTDINSCKFGWFSKTWIEDVKMTFAILYTSAYLKVLENNERPEDDDLRYDMAK